MPRFAVGALLIHIDPATGDLFTLLQQRSEDEHEPLTWCIFGGMAEVGETPVDCLLREIAEEAGLDIARYPRALAHIFEDLAGDFRYYTYVVPLTECVRPVLSHESVQARWVRLGAPGEPFWGRLPRPLHSGMLRLRDDPRVIETLAMFQGQAKALATV